VAFNVNCLSKTETLLKVISSESGSISEVVQGIMHLIGNVIRPTESYLMQ